MGRRGINVIRVGELGEFGVDEHIHVIRQIGILNELTIVVQLPFQRHFRVAGKVARVVKSHTIPVRTVTNDLVGGTVCHADVVDRINTGHRVVEHERIPVARKKC